MYIHINTRLKQCLCKQAADAWTWCEFTPEPHSISYRFNELMKMFFFSRHTQWLFTQEAGADDALRQGFNLAQCEHGDFRVYKKKTNLIWVTYSAVKKCLCPSWILIFFMSHLNVSDYPTLIKDEDNLSKHTHIFLMIILFIEGRDLFKTCITHLKKRNHH